jgi:hypothetical protein
MKYGTETEIDWLDTRQKSCTAPDMATLTVTCFCHAYDSSAFRVLVIVCFQLSKIFSVHCYT